MAIQQAVVFGALLVLTILSVADGAALLKGKVFDMAMETDKACRAKTDTEGESFVKFMVMNDEMDQKHKCYIHCVMHQFSAISHGGEFNLEEELLNIPDEIKDEGHEVIHTCKNVMGSDPCDTAFLIHKCYYETNKKLYSRILVSFYANTKIAPPAAAVAQAEA